jgi:hypothetical protein
MQKQIKVDVETRKKWKAYSTGRSYEEMKSQIPLGVNTLVTAFTKFMATPKSAKTINESIDKVN